MNTPQPRQVAPPKKAEFTWVEVRNHSGKLLFEYDPERFLIRIKPKGGPRELIDLQIFHPHNQPAP